MSMSTQMYIIDFGHTEACFAWSYQWSREGILSNFAVTMHVTVLTWKVLGNLIFIRIIDKACQS